MQTAGVERRCRTSLYGAGVLCCTGEFRCCVEEWNVVCTAKVCTTKVYTTKVCTTKVCTAKICTANTLKCPRLTADGSRFTANGSIGRLWLLSNTVGVQHSSPLAAYSGRCAHTGEQCTHSDSVSLYSQRVKVSTADESRVTGDG